MNSSSTEMGPEPYVIPLERAAEADPALAGEKSRRLGRALGAGFPVPPGFVVTTAAFRAFLAPLAGHVARRLAEVGSRPRPEIAALAAELMALVARTAIPPALAEEVRAALRRLGAPSVAVRSSAPGEDAASRSLAGLFESFLDVRGEEEVLARLRDCFASAFSERALAAARRDARAANDMAAIVQRMVPADHAGILFTRDPRGAAPGMVVELARGRGDAVAQGSVTPDRFGLDPRTGAAVPLSGGVAADLSPALFRALAALGARAEEIFGGPQDIEWAEAAGQVYLLQARPITGAGASAELWTPANSQEALEDPVTPLTYTFLRPAIERGRKKVFELLEVEDPPGEYMRLIDGRIYFNVKYFRTFLERVPGIPTEIFDRLIFGEGLSGATITFRMPPFERRTFKVFFVIARSWLGAKGRMDRFIERFSRWIEGAAATDVGALSDEALRAHLDDVSFQLEEAFNLHVLGTAMAGWHYLALSKFLEIEGLRGGAGENVADELVAAAPGMETARSGAAIFQLAKVAAGLPEVRRALFAEDPARALAALGPANAFREALDRFLEEHGHRAEKEAELAEPRWREDPRFILRLVRRVLEDGTRLKTPDEAEAALIERKRDLFRRIERHLEARYGFFGAAWRKAALRVLVRWAERYAPYRENVRFHALRAYELIRRAFLEWGRRLASRGALERAEDIFFLEADEALSALAEGPLAEGAAALRKASAARRAEYARHRMLREAAATAPGTAAIAEDGRRYLQGIPVSGGVVTGRVRRAERLDDALAIAPDEILLARAASPAWTPVFFLARGVLLDIGGMLSHCAVVAREYGIPCVVGAKHATALIRDGDIVTLDANAGRVYLPAGSEDSPQEAAPAEGEATPGRPTARSAPP